MRFRAGPALPGPFDQIKEAAGRVDDDRALGVVPIIIDRLPAQLGLDQPCIEARNGKRLIGDGAVSTEH
jgi:hypothetical protein